MIDLPLPVIAVVLVVGAVASGGGGAGHPPARPTVGKVWFPR